MRDHAWARESYIAHLIEATGTDLRGMKIAIDCANGAAHEFGPAVFRELGAEITVINAEPDGRNINLNAGSTHPEALQAAVVASGCDFGVAYDATLTAAWPSTTRARSSTVTRSWVPWPSTRASAAPSRRTRSS